MGPRTVVTVGVRVVKVSDHIDVPLLPQWGTTGRVVLAGLHLLDKRYLYSNKYINKGKSN